MLLAAAYAARGTRSSDVTIGRLDGSTVGVAPLTERIEALTRAAGVHGLTVTLFNDAGPIRKLRIHFEPGERFSYSGEGMTFLQIVIEKVTGKQLETLMQEHVFGPCGMTMSSYTWQPRFEPDYAIGHQSDGREYPKDKDNAARAPGTLETTTDDYARS